MNSENTTAGISSMVFPGGPTPSDSLESPTTCPACSQDPHPVSRFPARASSSELPTSATSGPICETSSRNSNLDLSSENKSPAPLDETGSQGFQNKLETALKARLGSLHTPEYVLTWKH